MFICSWRVISIFVFLPFKVHAKKLHHYFIDFCFVSPSAQSPFRFSLTKGRFQENASDDLLIFRNLASLLFVLLRGWGCRVGCLCSINPKRKQRWALIKGILILELGLISYDSKRPANAWCSCDWLTANTGFKYAHILYQFQNIDTVKDSGLAS